MAKTALSNFNKTHPELRDGEVFITNIWPGRAADISYDPNDPPDNRSDWECIGWKTKRTGHTAYDIYGKRIADAYPVFAQRAELQKAGVDSNKI